MNIEQWEGNYDHYYKQNVTMILYSWRITDSCNNNTLYDDDNSWGLVVYSTGRCR